MAEHVGLLPRNATKMELLLSEVGDPLAALADRYDDIRAADINTPPQFLPWLVWEYGLGELSPYLPNLTDLISEGLRWQRVRGTPAAIYRALGWLGYTGTVVDDQTRRKRWNRFQVRLGRVRDADLPDLSRINGVVDLSPPFRSQFFRGFRDYDIAPTEGSWTRGSGALGSNYSGVRIEAGKAKWSFGRTYDAAYTLSETPLRALGIWLPVVASGGTWSTDNRLWVTANVPWAYPAVSARYTALATALAAKTAYVQFRASSGAVIGYARATSRPVRSVITGGDYVFGASRYTADAGSFEAVVIRARTGFGDGDGQTAATMRLVFDPILAPGIGPGKLWLAPSEASGGVALDPIAVNIPFGKTVREHARFVVSFTNTSNNTQQPLGLLLAITGA